LPRLSLVWKVRDSLSLLSDVHACRYQQPLSRYITCQDVCVQESHKLKYTFEYLLPCYYYTRKTNSETIRSQVWQLAPAGSSVASKKNLRGGKNLVGDKMFDFRRIALFSLWYHLTKHKWLYVLNISGWHGPYIPPDYAYACRQARSQRGQSPLPIPKVALSIFKLIKFWCVSQTNASVQINETAKKLSTST